MQGIRGLSPARKSTYSTYPLITVVILAIGCTAQSSSQTPVLGDPTTGLRLLVMEENTLPTLRILLPVERASDREIEVVFPEHVTLREHGKIEAEHLYLWQPGRRGNRPAWRGVGQSL